MIKKSILVCLFLISFLLIGCSTNKNNDQVNQPSNNKKEESNIQEQNPITKEDYKQVLIKNYEKYLKPIDINNYDDLEDIARNSEEDNKKFIENTKIALRDTKSNIQAFSDSIKDLNIEDTNLNKLNMQLISDSKVLINDITSIEEEINKINDDMLSKTMNELEKYLETIVEKDKLDTDKFENTLEKIEDMLGIDLDDNSGK